MTGFYIDGHCPCAMSRLFHYQFNQKPSLLFTMHLMILRGPFKLKRGAFLPYGATWLELLSLVKDIVQNIKTGCNLP